LLIKTLYLENSFSVSIVEMRLIGMFGVTYSNPP